MAQTTPPPAIPGATQQTPAATPPAAATPSAEPGDSAAQQKAQPPVERPSTVQPGDSPVGNAERTALHIETIALDMHLNADTGAVVTRARLRVRNGGTSPLPRLGLQVSSALEWQSARLTDANGVGTPLPVHQFRVTTDTDHTGAVNELALALPKPLAPGAEAGLDLYYGGTLLASGERLLRLGAPEARASQADWDSVSAAFVGLRGFGNVVWYPVSAPAALLPDGDGFARAINAERERTAATTLQLSLTLEQTGGKLTTAWFLDRPVAIAPALKRREAAAAESKTPTSPDATPSSSSSSSAETASTSPNPAEPAPEQDPEQSQVQRVQWDAVRLDGRPVSLFVAGGDAAEETAFTANGPGSTAPALHDAGHVRVIGGDPAARQSYANAAEKVAPLLRQWLPSDGPLTVLPLPSPGLQPFADGGLLVTPARASDTATLAEALVYPLAAAALPTDAPAWVRKGVPEFLRLLYLEQTTGRNRMLAELGAVSPALQEAEAARGMDPLPLRSCVDPVCARGKATFALIMLRGIVGDAPLQQALQAILLPAAAAAGEADSGRAMTRRFEAAIAQSSSKDLQWFFADWFSADRGLPDLQIVEVAPRRVERGAATVTEPTKRGPRLGPLGTEPQAEPNDPRRSSPTAASRNQAGLPNGSWLVAVEVQNNGDAAAEVPVTVRAAGLQNGLPLRIPAHGRATIRVPFEATPEEVWVNDGTTPEQHGSTHHRTIEVTRAQ